MARTKILVPPEKQCGYTSVIVSYSTGIDSTGAIYWATQNFAPEKIFLLYCDTGAEYSVNEALFFKTAKVLGLKPILLKAPKDFLYLLLNERLKFPDSKNRWCTAYLKTAVTDHWIYWVKSVCSYLGNAGTKAEGVQSCQNVSITARH